MFHCFLSHWSLDEAFLGNVVLFGPDAGMQDRSRLLTSGCCVGRPGSGGGGGGVIGVSLVLSGEFN